MRTIRTQTKDSSRAESGYRVALLIREINSRLTAAIAGELAATGLTLPQVTLVKALAHGGELTITELSRELCVGKPTVVGVVDRLEKAGLVERRRSGEDRREVRVGFAPGSDARVRAIKRSVDATFAKAFASLPEDRVVELGRVLESVLGSIPG
jgi:DNA-binding MarR family transcriptional regulator